MLNTFVSQYYLLIVVKSIVANILSLKPGACVHTITCILVAYLLLTSITCCGKILRGKWSLCRSRSRANLMIWLHDYDVHWLILWGKLIILTDIINLFQPVGSREAHEDGSDCAGAAAAAAQGQDHLRLGHRRLGTEAHGLHGAPRHLGTGIALQGPYSTLSWDFMALRGDFTISGIAPNSRKKREQDN